MKNLISMTDFVVIESEKTTVHNVESQFKLIYDYAKFLQQLLEIWMFVPCKLVDGIWVVLEFPNRTDKQWRDGADMKDEFYETVSEYQQAKERCLFEGFFNTTQSSQYNMYIENGMQSVFYKSKNSDVLKKIIGMVIVEDLIKDTPVKLTPTAQKQFEL